VPTLGSTAQAAGSAPGVLLWVDTFNNYFRPHVTTAALDVLQRAGLRVSIPQETLCCGRPLYDFGMLDTAKAYLKRILRALAVEIDAGMPIVVLEPSCASVFRDELRNLFPDDPRADRLRRQTFLFAEFLAGLPDYEPPRLKQRVLLHRHCHDKALVRTDYDAALLRRMGAEITAPDAGCCGMAGAFGFAAETYAISRAIGERRLLPAVRDTPPGTLIVADGFSCAEQIAGGTGRRPLHVAEVVQLTADS
jgi:Fe-S oxidoreductase